MLSTDRFAADSRPPARSGSAQVAVTVKRLWSTHTCAIRVESDRRAVAMREVKFSAYRQYEDARVDANNSMIALLAGSRLAAHTLQLHADSPHQLPGLFPRVRDIDRFNLLPGRATELLHGADAHLAAVAIPYALAVYEAFVLKVADLLEADGAPVSRARGSMNAGRMHATVYRAAQVDAPKDTIALFHVLRCLRNAQIHRAGLASKELVEVVSELSDDQQRQWERLTMAPLAGWPEGKHIDFTVGHLIAAFAVTKEAARALNETLQLALSRRFWAGLAVLDYAETAKPARNSSGWKRGVLGFASFNYKALNFTAAELETAAIEKGVWTGGAWS